MNNIGLVGVGAFIVCVVVGYIMLVSDQRKPALRWFTAAVLITVGQAILVIIQEATR